MKKLKYIVVMLLLSVVALTNIASCTSLANMSYDDAYDIGYGAGALLRNVIDN